MRRYFTKKVAFDEDEAVSVLRAKAIVLGQDKILERLMDRIGNARIVMMGEATHGTHEYYLWRSLISQHLVEEKEFNFIAVEGDWPDCYALNRYAKNYDQSANDARQLLSSFNRWPTWMWANWEVAAFIEWLKQYNKDKSPGSKTGFYGLDVYSLWESMEAIMNYLGKNDPAAYKIAEEAFRCFEPYKNNEGREYAMASRLVPELCTTEVLSLLKEIQLKLPQYNSDPENVFSTEQNAHIAVNAERYYRAMIAGGPHSWNVRDKHMQDTLDRLLQYHGPSSKAIVWAHNTHIGDARATDMVNEGMYNIGELSRLKYKHDDVFLLGFGSYKGQVIAGKSWGADMRTIDVPAAMQGSWEYLLHKTGSENKLLFMEDIANDLFMEQHFGHRAIGVVYNPAYEQYGNYVPTILPLRYDAFIHIDETTALHPLHIQPDGTQIPETYPFGI